MKNFVVVALLLLVVAQMAIAFRSIPGRRPMNPFRPLQMQAAEADKTSPPPVKAHETQIAAPTYGKQFFAADVGTPAWIKDYGGGDVGATEFEDALYHARPRGANKPKIEEKAVVKLPDMRTVYRGHKDFRRADGTMAAEDESLNFKTTPWTSAEDEQLRLLMASDAGGTRGRWTRFSKIMRRSTADLSARWIQVLNPPDQSGYKDIVRDAEIPPDWYKQQKKAY